MDQIYNLMYGGTKDLTYNFSCSTLISFFFWRALCDWLGIGNVCTRSKHEEQEFEPRRGKKMGRAAL
jgi:hypothetical protein